jgi:hypothetical protein
MLGRALNEELVRRFSRWLFALNYSECTLDKYPRTVRRFVAFLHPKKVVVETCAKVRIRTRLGFSSRPGHDEQSAKSVGKVFSRKADFGVRLRSSLTGTGESNVENGSRQGAVLVSPAVMLFKH